jgi:hypothetical protein
MEEMPENSRPETKKKHFPLLTFYGILFYKVYRPTVQQSIRLMSRRTSGFLFCLSTKIIRKGATGT